MQPARLYGLPAQYRVGRLNQLHFIFDRSAERARSGEIPALKSRDVRVQYRLHYRRSPGTQNGINESRRDLQIVIDNPTGGPKGFQFGNELVMAVVPMVTQAMVSVLTKERLGGGDPVRSRSIGAHFGSYPCCREDGCGTNLVMRGTDEAEFEEMKEEFRRMIISLGAKPLEE